VDPRIDAAPLSGTDGDAFAKNLVADLAGRLYDAESNLLLNATTGAMDMPAYAGINQLTDTMTRAADIGTTDTAALDTSSKAFVDLRSNASSRTWC
jgi:hypothetical protein